MTRFNERVRRLLLGATCLLTASLAAPGAHAADNYPSRPITIVVPFGTGSGSDVVARLYSRFITEVTGGTVVVENRPGANAMIGAQHVARAAPDGYTVLMGSGTSNAVNYALYADRIAYKPQDFETVATIYVTPPVVFAANGVAGETIPAVLAEARKSPKGVTCGNGNAVTLVACEMLKRITGAEVVPVSYKGNGQSLADLAGGQIAMAIADMAAASPFVVGKRIRPVAVAAYMQLSTLPGIGTAREQGVDLDFLSWNAVFVPAGTPAPIVARLNEAARRMLASPEWEKQRQATGGVDVDASLDGSRKFVAAEIAKWERYVKQTGVKVQ